MLCAGLFKTEAALALLQKAQYKTSPVLFLILSFFPPRLVYNQRRNLKRLLYATWLNKMDQKAEPSQSMTDKRWILFLQPKAEVGH